MKPGSERSGLLRALERQLRLVRGPGFGILWRMELGTQKGELDGNWNSPDLALRKYTMDPGPPGIQWMRVPRVRPLPQSSSWRKSNAATERRTAAPKMHV